VLVPMIAVNRGSAALLVTVAIALSAAPAKGNELHYRAPLHSVNPVLTGKVGGDVQFSVSDEKLRARVEVNGVGPRTMHLQPVHGYRAPVTSRSAPLAFEKGFCRVL
jgi:hypothetical protein